MLDPVPPPPDWLFNITKPYAEALGFPTLPHHIHEVIFAFVLYQNIELILSPRLSTWLFPNIYPKLNRRTRINWDVHVVSLIQSGLINTLALWVMFRDEERYDMRHSAVERVHGYTGASGLIQAFAAGYFLWDFIVSSRHLSVFGLGIWAHALSALTVFSFGFVSAPILLSIRHADTNIATFCKLLRPRLHPLRALHPLPQCPLVLRQARYDGQQTTVVQRSHTSRDLLRLPPGLGHIPIRPCLPRYLAAPTNEDRPTRPRPALQRRQLNLRSQRRSIVRR